MMNSPANPRFLPASKELLNRLYALWGHWTLSGQSNPISGLDRYTTRMQQICGEWPAVWAADFGFSADRNGDDYIGDRDGILDEVERQSRAGSLIQLDFIPANPVIGEPCNGQDLVDRISDRDWEAMLTPGTSVFTRWRTQLAIIAVYLRYLKDMGIVVLFHPCPAMNSRRWWWGDRPGPAGYAGLWRSVFDHYVHDLHLDNLLWVWSAESGGADPVDFYPGHHMVDILGCDCFPDAMSGNGPERLSMADWNRLLKLAEGRPLALTRTDFIPDDSSLTRQRWLWFTVARSSWEACHHPEDVRVLYAGSHLLHRKDWREPHLAR